MGTRTIRYLYSFATNIIVQTHFAKNDLVKNFSIPEEKIVIIPNWVVHSGKKTPIRLKKVYDLLYCGRFAKQKNLTRLLRITKEVKKTHPDIKLCLVGEGEEEVHIQEKIVRLGLKHNVIVKPTSFVVENELQKAKIFALTSDFEGQPMILLEAMAQAIPVVTLRSPGENEYILHEKNGFIEADEKSFAKRVELLLADSQLSKKIGKNAKNSVKKTFNDSLIKETLSYLLS